VGQSVRNKQRAAPLGTLGVDPQLDVHGLDAVHAGHSGHGVHGGDSGDGVHSVHSVYAVDDVDGIDSCVSVMVLHTSPVLGHVLHQNQSRITTHR